jgi:hypothetical protein
MATKGNPKRLCSYLDVADSPDARLLSAPNPAASLAAIKSASYARLWMHARPGSREAMLTIARVSASESSPPQRRNGRRVSAMRHRPRLVTGFVCVLGVAAVR